MSGNVRRSDCGPRHCGRDAEHKGRRRPGTGRRHVLIMLALCLGSVLATTRPAAQGVDPSSQPIVTLLRAVLEAQRTFDVSRLDQLLAPDYVEVSPLGEVDERAAVLSFYASDKRPAKAPPSVTLDNVNIRIYGDVAVAVGRVAFQIQDAEPSSPLRELRAVYVVRASGGRWQLVSSQYTPIRRK